MKMSMAGMIVLCLAGCAGKSAPEKHAWYFSQHTVGTLNGNFQTPRAKVYRLNLPEFEKMYQQGVSDKSAGKDLAYANAFAAEIRKQAETPHQVTNSFQGNAGDQWQNTADKKEAELWFGELAGVYLDGYNGVK